MEFVFPWVGRPRTTEPSVVGANQMLPRNVAEGADWKEHGGLSEVVAGCLFC